MTQGSRRGACRKPRPDCDFASGSAFKKTLEAAVVFDDKFRIELPVALVDSEGTDAATATVEQGPNSK